MSTPIRRNAYNVHPDLEQFLNTEVLPLTGIDSEQFWNEFIRLIDDFAPENRKLLNVRDELQAAIDAWHQEHQGQPFDPVAYKAFLTEIGYLVPEPSPFQISPTHIDPEIATTAGPQLVVPLKNARFALNAANARWGSLYDALYGTDVIPDAGSTARGNQYNPVRGDQVIAMAKAFLDEHFPLAKGKHSEVSAYAIDCGQLSVVLTSGDRSALAKPSQFVAFHGSTDRDGTGQPSSVLRPSSVLLQNNGLRVELVLNPNGVNGKNDTAHLDDLLLESAITTIMDCEDSVAAVDCADKLEIYRNWLGLTQGNLTAVLSKSGREITRCLQGDRTYTGRDGSDYLIPGRSLQLIRNVGLHMYSDMVVDEKGNETPEGIIDAVVTVMIAALGFDSNAAITNSRCGSVYVVKPKLHGPDEAAFSCRLFDRVEAMLGMPPNTVKLGIMDEERRTSLNLAACIAEAQERIAFINTGFLDRTGDEIHTSMQAGAFLPKGLIKSQPWFACYEDNNVASGLAGGFGGRAQIGKGMWPKPDAMKDMLGEKSSHPAAGASTAWVPSPTAATLHAMHYHQVSVESAQQALIKHQRASINPMLGIPLIPTSMRLSSNEIERELENNIQGILGYVVHWINAGVGCSKIPDIDNVGLMEDRATLRISSQHIANWLLHGMCSEQQVGEILKRMAAVVDKQNVGNSEYQPMANNLENSMAFAAARELIFDGVAQPNGYTEPTLHKYRKAYKAAERPAAASGLLNQ